MGISLLEQENCSTIPNFKNVRNAGILQDGIGKSQL